MARFKEWHDRSGMREIRTLEAEFQKLKAASGKGGAVGAEQAGGTVEKNVRTVTFGQFPKDTKATQITDFIRKVMEPVKDELEEVFAFGSKRAERGAARFRTKEMMWKYMTEHAGRHQHLYQGGTKVYCNVDSAGLDKEKNDKERAVRKVVRAIIEKMGGDGAQVKKEVETDYRRGIVWWRDVRVAEWSEGGMQFLGEAKNLEAAFQVLCTRQ